jgi:hypothetical protein
MNYEKIHNHIIERAKARNLPANTYYEKHHIIPKCEGGSPDGEMVKLTLKEHRLIHLLRYKITGIFGNINAFNWMTQPENIKRNNSSQAAKLSHKKHNDRDPEAYANKQRNAGIAGGNKAYKNKKGFHSIPEDEMIKIRLRGTKTIVDNKLGMFSDEYRKIHKAVLQKPIMTPSGKFKSMLDASKYYGVVPATITYRVNGKNEEWYYLTKEEYTI